MKMSIYRIRHNIDDFMFFTIDDLDVYDKMEDFNINGFGQPFDFKWVAPKAEFIAGDSGLGVKPDITQWSGTDLILNDKARHVLGSALGSLGEFLPLAGADNDHCLFNPIVRMGNEIIDLEHTKSAYFNDGSWDRLERLEFNNKAEKLAPCLFTLEIDRGVNLYCSDSFKTVIEKNGLQGLLFEAIDGSHG